MGKDLRSPFIVDACRGNRLTIRSKWFEAGLGLSVGNKTVSNVVIIPRTAVVRRVDEPANALAFVGALLTVPAFTRLAESEGGSVFGGLVVELEGLELRGWC